MSDLEDGANCLQCGIETITDAKGICFDCWAENDLLEHEKELAKKKTTQIDLEKTILNDMEE